MGEGDQKIQTSRYKINKSSPCDVQHGRIQSLILYYLCMVTDGNYTYLETILQCIQMLNHYVVHMKLICCMSIIFQFLKLL